MSEDLTPQLKTYPICSDCKAPYILKRFLNLVTGGHQWAWARDCKHKAAEAEIIKEED